jgi:predicted exporter
VPAAGVAQGVELRPAQWPLRIASLLGVREALLQRLRTPVLLALLMPSASAACCTWRRNDIRQWVGTPQQLTDEAQTMARITGYQPTSQFFLVRGANQQELLERQAA